MRGRRVVITGIGMVSPLGIGREVNWDMLLHGNSAYGEVPGFEPSTYMPKKDVKKLGRFAHYAVAAAAEAIEDAELPQDRQRTAVVMGASIGASEIIEAAARGKPVGPFYLISILPNIAAGYVSIQHGITGPNLTIATACASGGHAVGQAYRMIQNGDAESAVTGGTEAMTTDLNLTGFDVIGALSKRGFVSPFDRDRDGILLSEGAGVLVLEELETAKRRGAHIYAEVVGFGMSSDAHGLAAPSPDGAGAAQAMERALADSMVGERCIDYINAHGTGTPLGDAAETVAIKTVFGEQARKLAVSSTKGATGHLLGAAGGYEAAACALALRDGIVPPTTNYLSPDPACDLDYVPNEARGLPLEYAMSNSFGFGGTNSCLIFRKSV